MRIVFWGLVCLLSTAWCFHWSHGTQAPTDKSNKTTEDALSTVTTQIGERCDALQQLMDRRWDAMAAKVFDLRSQFLPLRALDNTPKSQAPIFPPPTIHHDSSSSLPAHLLPSASSPTGIPKPPKIHLPLFYGSHPHDWIFQSEPFFEFYKCSTLPTPRSVTILPLR